MSFNVFAIFLVFMLIYLLYLQRKMESKDAVRFYEEVEVGDVFDHVTDGNVFIQPAEVLTILDKKSGYVKYTLWIRKTGEVFEKSCSGREFYDKVCYFGLVKRNKSTEKTTV